MKTIFEQLQKYHPDTYLHSLRVGRMCLLVAESLRFSSDHALLIMRAGVLHDIGKLTVPIPILDKPGSLSCQEYETMKTHVANGVELMKKKKENPLIIAALQQHHEREDGSGYPAGIIPTSEIARVVAVCDVFDALVNHRPYREALPKEEVLQGLLDGAYGSLHKPYVQALQTIVYKLNSSNLSLVTNSRAT